MSNEDQYKHDLKLELFKADILKHVEQSLELFLERIEKMERYLGYGDEECRDTDIPPRDTVTVPNMNLETFKNEFFKLVEELRESINTFDQLMEDRSNSYVNDVDEKLGIRQTEIIGIFNQRIEQENKHFNKYFVAVHEHLDELTEDIDTLSDKHSSLLERIGERQNEIMDLLHEFHGKNTDNLKHIEANFVSINNNNMERFDQLDENAAQSYKTIEFILTEHLKKTDKEQYERLAFLESFVKELDKIAAPETDFSEVVERFIELEDRSQRRHKEIIKQLNEIEIDLNSTPESTP